MYVENQFQESGLTTNLPYQQLIINSPTLVNEKTSKMEYYLKLKSQNHDMLNKIKEINAVLDEQIKNIQKKYVQKLSVPLNKGDKVNAKRKGDTQKKYKQIDRLQKQLEEKLVQKHSLSAFQQKLNSLKAQYKQKYTNMEQNRHQLNKLKKLQGKNTHVSTKQTTIQSSETPASIQMKIQIDELRGKIKKQINRIYTSKQEFINNNKKQRKSHSFLTNKKQESRDMTPARNHDDGMDENLSSAVKQLKAQYLRLGKRIQILKIQKLGLVIDTDHQDRLKYLKHLQAKIIELKKLSPLSY